MSKPLRIFKPGTHYASNGKPYTFSDVDLIASANAYDPAKLEAPLVIGHPKTDDPAYGWAKALKFADGHLTIEPQQVEPQFAELVNSGRFKQISPSFYSPDDPANPVPGVWYVRHVGFLGAAAPGCKGLPAASFSDDGSTAIEFADWQGRAIAALFRRLRDWIISEKDLEAADAVIPDWQIQQLEQEPSVGFAEPIISKEQQDMQTQADRDAAAKLQADKDALERERTEFAERQKAFDAQQAKALRAETVSFVEGLVKAGQVLPREKEGLIAFMCGPNEAGVIEFAEGEETKTAKPNEWLRTFLAALPKQVDFSERSAATRADDRAVSFAAPAGYAVDPARLELHNKALAYQQAHAGASYDAAIAAVSH